MVVGDGTYCMPRAEQLTHTIQDNHECNLTFSFIYEYCLHHECKEFYLLLKSHIIDVNGVWGVVKMWNSHNRKVKKGSILVLEDVFASN